MTYGYPPQGNPGHGYAPTPPEQPKKMSTGKKVVLFGCLPVTLLGLLVMGGCAALVGGAANEIDKSIKKDEADDKRAAKEDVEITSCKVVNDDLLGPDLKAKVKITNHGDKRATYIVRGELLDQDGNKVGDELLATVDNLAPGKSSNQDFGGLFTADNFKGVTDSTCKIVGVSREEWLADN